MDESQASPAVATALDDTDYGADDWNVEVPIGLDEVERVDAKHRSRDFQDRCRAKKRKVAGTVTKTFEQATELIDREATADGGPSTELIM